MKKQAQHHDNLELVQALNQLDHTNRLLEVNTKLYNEYRNMIAHEHVSELDKLLYQREAIYLEPTIETQKKLVAEYTLRIESQSQDFEAQYGHASNLDNWKRLLETMAIQALKVQNKQERKMLDQKIKDFTLEFEKGEEALGKHLWTKIFISLTMEVSALETD